MKSIRTLLKGSLSSFCLLAGAAASAAPSAPGIRVESTTYSSAYLPAYNVGTFAGGAAVHGVTSGSLTTATATSGMGLLSCFGRCESGSPGAESRVHMNGGGGALWVSSLVDMQGGTGATITMHDTLAVGANASTLQFQLRINGLEMAARGQGATANFFVALQAWGGSDYNLPVVGFGASIDVGPGGPEVSGFQFTGHGMLPVTRIPSEVGLSYSLPVAPGPLHLQWTISAGTQLVDAGAASVDPGISLAIVGDYQSLGGFGYAAPVPEPSSVLLWLAGGLALLWRRGWLRRRHWGKALLPLALATPAYAKWSVTTLDRPGAAGTQPWEINDAGTIVGGTADGLRNRGFIYEAGVWTLLDGPAGAAYAEATGVSNAGLVVGIWSAAGLEQARSFLYEQGTYSLFDLPGSTSTQLRHVSANGRYLTGTYLSAANSGGFVHDRLNATTVTFADGGSTFGYVLQGANNAGLVTGSYLGPPSGAGFVYDLASGTIVATMPGARLRDINEAGLVTGALNSRAVAGTIAGGLVEVPVGATPSFGYGLNDRDQLVGWYNDASGKPYGFIASQVPELPHAVLLAAGLGLAAARRMRHR